jgi:sialic acid synthase SpsE
MSKKTMVIAEAGSSHDGIEAFALELVRQAKANGADAVKFQFYSDADAYAEQRGVPDAYREIYRAYQLPESWLPLLQQEAARYGMQFMCTAFLPQDVEKVAPFVDAFKVASFEAEFEPLLTAIGPYLSDGRRKLFLSLGMSADPTTALEVADRFTSSSDQVVMMHCVSGYPTPPAQLNLGSITGRRTGYSDHSDPKFVGQRYVGAFAVMAGADYVEAHFRLDATKFSNPDYAHSMNPERFGDYVAAIRLADICYGDGNGDLQPVEQASRAYRSVERPKEKS